MEKANNYLGNQESIENNKSLKQEFTKMLELWFNVMDENSYESLKKLAKKILDFDMCDYAEITSRGLKEYWREEWWEKYHEFSMTLDSDNKRINLHPYHEWPSASSFWYIKDWKFIKDYQFLEFDKASNNTSEISQELLNLLEEVDQWAGLENPPEEVVDQGEDILEDNTGLIEEPVVVEDVEKVDIEYDVKKWDTLWSLAKEYYSLTSNRDIANVVNKIVKYNLENGWKSSLSFDKTNDGIKWDRIYVGDKIKLPPTLQFREQVFNRK